ncbi:MAG: response regulator [bacterium]|nr:response regulator [bacterium]
MNILLVDDEEHILKIIADFLADCGYQTVTAANGTEALKCLERGADIGLIVSDIRMPKMDGLEFLRSVRVRFPGVPVVLITGHGDEQIAVAALQEGAFDYLKKPLKLNEFLSCVERVDERNQLEDRLLRDYQNLLHSKRDSASDHPAALTDKQIRKEVTSIDEALQNLEAIWDTLRGCLDTCQPEKASEQARLDFIRDEIPSLLAAIRQKIRYMTNVPAEGAESGSRDRVTEKMLEANKINI